MKIVRPDCAITCERQNCINRENANEIVIDCTNCRDKDKCANES